MKGPTVNGSSALKAGSLFTVQDYLSWDDGLRWELIDGEAFSMSAAPTRHHQKLVGNLFVELSNFLEGKTCESYIAPIDVFLDEDSVVQPDVLVVCDKTKLADEGIRGAPDFIAEVLSDSTGYKDISKKKDLYEAHGVREYWIISPENGTVFVYILAKDQPISRETTDDSDVPRYLPVREYRKQESVASAILEGFVWGPRTVGA